MFRVRMVAVMLVVAALAGGALLAMRSSQAPADPLAGAPASDRETSGSGGRSEAAASSLGVSETQSSRESTDMLHTATFGSGCFWCTEAVFLRLNGVQSAVSGYSGGHVENPTYREVCEGTTGHAEVIQVTYDPAVVSYDELLEVFWKTHDPTTLNRQGNDIGTQYRSVVFYHDEQQRERAEHYKQRLEAEGVFSRPIVTQIEPLEKFYPAEDYHQNYFELNPGQGYCQAVVRPKVEKFEKVFRDKLKPKR